MNQPAWTDAAALEDVWEGDVIGRVVAGRELALHNVGGTVYATDNVCTHGQARLCEGFLDGHQIECPLHQGTFDVRTGEPTGAPASVAIRCYPVKVDAGRVWVEIAPAG